MTQDKSSISGQETFSFNWSKIIFEVVTLLDEFLHLQKQLLVTWNLSAKEKLVHHMNPRLVNSVKLHNNSRVMVNLPKTIIHVLLFLVELSLFFVIWVHLLVDPFPEDITDDDIVNDTKAVQDARNNIMTMPVMRQELLTSPMVS